jgi:uncharacterized repeat protein (TIGR04076 family)
MKTIDSFLLGILKRFMKNRCGLTEAEMQGFEGFFEFFNSETIKYWVKADPVCSKRCSAGHYEGRPLYFNPLGFLIKHKCPPWICAHAIAQLSPVIYSYFDFLMQGKGADRMVFKHVTCTDPGRERGGLGTAVFRITSEKMPLLERLRFVLPMVLGQCMKNKRAIGDCQAIKEAPAGGGPEPDEYMRRLPLDERSLEAFLASPERVRRLRAIERFHGHRIVVRVTSSDACIAGHKKGDEFLIDPMGKVLPLEDGNGICFMALNKIWYRVIVALERMARSVEGEGEINSAWYGIPMSCFGAGLPLGPCGQIMMTLELRKG